MSAIDFTDNTTVVPAAWLDDVDASVYEQTGVGKTTVASATTPDIFAVTVGRLIDYTGTATCTGFVAAVSAGSHRTLYCAGAAVFTADANLLIDGVASAASITMAAGDVIDVYAITTTQFKLTTRKHATSLAASGIVSGATATGVDTTAAVVGLASSTGYGVYGRSSTGTGVFGHCTGGGANGHGVVAMGDYTSPISSAFRIVTQDAQPSGPNEVGDIYVTTAGVLKICTVAGTPGTWVSVGTQS